MHIGCDIVQSKVVLYVSRVKGDGNTAQSWDRGPLVDLYEQLLRRLDGLPTSRPPWVASPPTYVVFEFPSRAWAKRYCPQVIEAVEDLLQGARL